MAKFPIDYTSKDSEEIVDAVNYLLSGPSGLGQNFDGVNYFEPSWLTGALRTPTTIRPYATRGVAASGASEVIVTEPGSGTNPRLPQRIFTGQTVLAQNLAFCEVDTGYTTGSTIPLTGTFTGPLRAFVYFYDEYPVFPLYIAPIALSTVEYVDLNTVKATFTATQPTAPFKLGQIPEISGTSISGYNRTYNQPGVVESNVNYVILQRAGLPDFGNSTGGSITVSNTIKPPPVGVVPSLSSIYQVNGTDCLADATVQGVSDRVAISAQLKNIINITVTSPTVFQYNVLINRYIKSQINSAQSNQGLITGLAPAGFDAVISAQRYVFTLDPGVYSLDEIDTTFGTIIDQPSAETYLYRIDVSFTVINDTGAAEVTSSRLGTRSISVQVVKE